MEMDSAKMSSRNEEEEEVRSLLLRHQDRIMLDLSGTELLAVLVKNSVLTQSEEDLLLKTHYATAPSSAPSSVLVSKRKLSAVVSSGSASSSTGVGGGEGNYGSSIAGSSASANNSRSASVNGDHAQSDNRSITPSVISVGDGSSSAGGNHVDYCTKDEINDADILRMQCANLIDIIAKSGFEKFKQFCYAIESECPQLIDSMINDRINNERIKCGKCI